MSFYVYVDGESHYIRYENMARKKLGAASLDMIRRRGNPSGYSITIRPDCHFVWDAEFLPDRHTSRRKVYFTSFTGTTEAYQAANEFLRSQYFEPQIIKEDKDLREKRLSRLRDAALIEKPKGADIALAARMIEDAVLNNYDKCGLFTTDADYLPVIKAVRRMGKYVVVYGFKADVGNPELKYVPDEFVDLGHYFTRDSYELASSGVS